MSKMSQRTLPHIPQNKAGHFHTPRSGYTIRALPFAGAHALFRASYSLATHELISLLFTCRITHIMFVITYFRHYYQPFRNVIDNSLFLFNGNVRAEDGQYIIK